MASCSFDACPIWARCVLGHLVELNGQFVGRSFVQVPVSFDEVQQAATNPALALAVTGPSPSRKKAARPIVSDLCFFRPLPPKGEAFVANRRDDWPLPPCIVRSRDTRGTVNTAGGCAHGRSRGNGVTLAAYFPPQARKTPSFSCAAFPPGPPLRPRRHSWLVRQSSQGGRGRKAGGGG